MATEPGFGPPRIRSSLPPLVLHAGGLEAGGPKAVATDLSDWARRLAPLPIWIFRGAKDEFAPAERSQRMSALLEGAGAKDARLTMLAGKGHGITDSMFDPALYDWLMHPRSWSA